MIESFNGGLVTSRDPSLLQPGELQQCENLTYVPNNQGLIKVPGRTLFNQASVGTLTGLKYCAFDAPDPDVLIAQTPSAYLRANLIDASFSSIGSIAGGATLDAVHYRNKHYLLNGSNINQVLSKDGSLRAHGLAPVTAAPAVNVVTTGGAWPLGSSSVPNYFEYWTTEVYINGDEEIEGTFQGVPATVYILNTNYYVQIKRPDVVNIRPNHRVTHWRVYRSIQKSINVGIAFPNGFKIADVPIDSQFFYDGLSTTISGILPTTIEDGPLYLDPLGNPFTIPWIDKGNAAAADAVYAVGHAKFQTVAGGYQAQLMASGFALSSVGSPITDVSVEVKGYHSTTGGGLFILLSPDGGVSWTLSQSVYLGANAGSPQTVTVSGLWGRTWGAADFDTSLFRVLVRAYATVAGTDISTSLDYVKVSVTHSGTTASQAIAFPTLLPLAAIGRHGNPPIANTGDVFEDSLVTNDIANPTLIAYSTQENPDSFPPFYVLSFQTKDKDTVRCVKTLGNVLMVGLFSKLFRVNYLPRETDAEFDRGRAIDLISADHGIVGPRAACVFQMDSQPLQMAYVSRYGLHITDGYRVTTLTNDLDWASLVEIEALAGCEIVNDPSRYQLILHFPPKGETSNNQKLHFNYHPTHLKGDKLKISGPMDYRCVATTVASLDTGSIGMWTGRADGFVYQENSGSVDASGGDMTPVLKTREMYLAQPGEEFKINKVLLHLAASEPTTMEMTTEVAKTNAAVRVGITPLQVPSVDRGMIRFPMNLGCEAVTFRLTEGGNGDLNLNYMVIDGENFATEDSLA